MSTLAFSQIENGVSATNNNTFEVWNPPGLGGECQMKIETFVTSWLIMYVNLISEYLKGVNSIRPVG